MLDAVISASEMCCYPRHMYLSAHLHVWIFNIKLFPPARLLFALRFSSPPLFLLAQLQMKFVHHTFSLKFIFVSSGIANQSWSLPLLRFVPEQEQIPEVTDMFVWFSKRPLHNPTRSSRAARNQSCNSMWKVPVRLQVAVLTSASSFGALYRPACRTRSSLADTLLASRTLTISAELSWSWC